MDRKVIGFDINAERISELMAGLDSTLEVDNETLKSVLIKDVLDEKLPFWSYSNLAERATNLTKLGLFKKEIEFLINAAKDGSLPTEKDYRIRLNEIVSGGIC